MKPFIVFKNAKRETKALSKEFKTRYVIVSSSNGWMNDDLTMDILKKFWELSLLVEDF